jgi:hypothetical protein
MVAYNSYNHIVQQNHPLSKRKGKVRKGEDESEKKQKTTKACEGTEMNRKKRKTKETKDKKKIER